MKNTAFGESYAPGTAVGVEQRYDFAGRTSFPNNPAKDNRWRTNNTGIGRFEQRDPIRYLAGINIYEHVKSRVLRLSDPFGLNGRPEKFQEEEVSVNLLSCSGIVTTTKKNNFWFDNSVETANIRVKWENPNLDENGSFNVTARLSMRDKCCDSYNLIQFFTARFGGYLVSAHSDITEALDYGQLGTQDPNDEMNPPFLYSEDMRRSLGTKLWPDTPLAREAYPLEAGTVELRLMDAPKASAAGSYYYTTYGVCAAGLNAGRIYGGYVWALKFGLFGRGKELLYHNPLVLSAPFEFSTAVVRRETMAENQTRILAEERAVARRNAAKRF